MILVCVSCNSFPGPNKCIPETEFDRRFSNFKSCEVHFRLFTSSLSNDIEIVDENLQMELIDIQCDFLLKEKCMEVGIPEFYTYLSVDQFPKMLSFVTRILAMFGSTYLCEQLFFLMRNNKNSERSRLTDQHISSILKIASAQYIQPNIDDLLCNKRCQISSKNYKERKRRQREAWYEEIKALETVEEKLFKINMPRYYGWKLLLLKEDKIPYDTLKYTQYITRTHVMKETSLPSYYNNVISTEQLDSMVEAIKSNIVDDITLEYCSQRRSYDISNEDIKSKREMEDIVSKAIIERINKTILIHLSSKYSHLLNAEVDIEPRLEASWFIGLEPSERIKEWRKKANLPDDCINEMINLPVQYLGQPVVHLRYKYPLKEIISLSECENPDLDVPRFNYHPVVVGHTLDRQHVTNIPGFWPGDENEFGLLSYHNCIYLQERQPYFDDMLEAKIGQAILASYSWLLTQACYQGFSTFNDITYPLTTQTIITDGQSWSFFVYQLNTLLVHSEHIDTNPKRNICWVTKPMKLFDKIENEVIYGLNEEVLKYLIKFYVNVPEERIGVDMKPYLGKSVKVIADIEHDEKRNWLEKQYKHLMSNRSRHRRLPDIYNWQKIYLINHKTRPIDKKREPFEHGINIYQRSLDDHHPAYIPKCLRENPKKKKIGRWLKTYYP